MADEFVSLINIPEGLAIDPSGPILNVDYALYHRDNGFVEITDGLMLNTMPLLALCSIARMELRLLPDGRPWLPRAQDLNDAGRMLICMLLDAHPDHGEQSFMPRLEQRAQWEALRSIGIQQKQGGIVTIDTPTQTQLIQ